MNWNRLALVALTLSLLTAACRNQPKSESGPSQPDTVTTPTGETTALPEPGDSKTHFSKVIGWKAGETPQAPEGLQVSLYANGFDNPRWIYQAPNGDILISEANSENGFAKKVVNTVRGKSQSENEGGSANRITMLRDRDGDGMPELRTTFLKKLRQPFGMLVLGDKFYVANTDGVVVYPYKTDDTAITGQGKLILSLPAQGYNNHWTRNLIANEDGSKLYVSVGSGSNVAEHGIEHETRRANILEINPDGSGEKVYAAGLRNPVGMAWAPGTHTLWTAVNERDGLGDALVPDYMTAVKEGGFYGWPYSYYGQHEDPRRKGERPDLVQKALVPDVPLGSHTASLGLAFYTGSAFPEKYRGGAFVGQHGSWNRSAFSGYKVVFVPFKGGKPTGPPEDFLTGFIANDDEVHGRPVGVTVLKDGSMLVADDAANTIWRVSAR